MRFVSIIFLFASIFFSSGCGGTKGLTDDQEGAIPFIVPFSLVQVPVRIKKEDLERNINQQLTDTLYSDQNADGNGLQILAQKQADISVNLGEKVLEYTVPLKVFIRKDLRLTEVRAEGAISMTFQTNYEINQDWTLETQTKLFDYHWVEKPKLKVGFVQLPVQLIADNILSRSKEMITAAIDEQVKSNLDLKTQIENAWRMLQDPFLVSEVYRTWMLLEPKRIEMTPIKMEKEVISATIILESTPNVYLGEQPGTPEEDRTALPPFQWSDSNASGFDIHLETEIPYTEAEQLAKDNMLGQRFESGKRYVIVEDLKLYGQGNRLVVETDLSGSYNGKVNLIGKPQYNRLTNKLEFQNLDVELKTKNVLYRTLGWLFKGAFKKQIRESLDYYVNFYLDQMRESIQNEFNNLSIAPGVIVNGNLDDFTIEDAYAGIEGIKVLLSLNGGIEVEVQGLTD